MHLALFAHDAPTGRRPDVRTAKEIRRTARDLACTLRDATAKDVVRLAKQLIANGDRHLAYELVAAHPEGLENLGARDVQALGRGIEEWSSVDQFACFVAGQAWRRGQIEDALVMRWARSDDRWWRRAAVVSTVPLNAKSRGGDGDATRTLAVCRAVMADRDEMVVKAVSWALRELSKRDRRAVERFLDKHGASVASLVRREVTNKLQTGRKSGTRRRVR